MSTSELPPVLLTRCLALASRYDRPVEVMGIWEKRLIWLLGGLNDGRLTFGMDTDEAYSIAALDVGRPEDLGAPLLVALTIAANSPEVWRAGPDWRTVEAIAKAMASDLTNKLAPEDRTALDEGMAARLTRYLEAIRGRSLPRTGEIHIDV